MSQSSDTYSDPAIDMSQSNHLRRGEGGGSIRMSKNPRGDPNRRLKPTRASFSFLYYILNQYYNYRYHVDSIFLNMEKCDLLNSKRIALK